MTRWTTRGLAVVLGLCASTSALALPDVDSPLKTGNRAPTDAGVVIGIEDYAFISDVPYAERDARAMYEFLLYTRGVPAGNLRLLDRGANKEIITSAVDEAAALAGPDGTVWVYYAGHGAASPSTGERMLLGVDAQTNMEAFEARSVLVSDLRTRASASGAKVMMVVDSCFSGKGRSGSDLLPGKRFSVPDYAIDETPGVLEWSAAGPDELSGPLGAAKHGAFTYFVLGALRGWADGQMDGQRDGTVTAEEARFYVEDALRAVQITEQRPVLVVEGAADWVLTEAKGRLEATPEINATSIDHGGTGDNDGGSGNIGELATIGDPDVERVVARQHGKLLYCFEQRKALVPDLHGDVALRWTMDQGRVTAAVVQSNSTGDEALGLCLARKVKDWSFPEHLGGEIVYPFSFGQEGAGEDSPSRLGMVTLLGSSDETVSVDGRVLGQLPVRVELTEGSHTFLVRSSRGTHEVIHHVRLDSNSQAEVRVGR